MSSERSSEESSEENSEKNSEKSSEENSDESNGESNGGEQRGEQRRATKKAPAKRCVTAITAAASRRCPGGKAAGAAYCSTARSKRPAMPILSRRGAITSWAI